MARRKRRNGRFASTTKVIRVGQPRAAAPIIRVSAPRAAPAKRRGRRRRSGGRLSGIGSMFPSWDYALGGLAYGFAVKQGWIGMLPAIPIIGRTGTAAIVLNYLGKRNIGGDLVRKAGVAAACIAGYQLGSTGAIMGGEHFQTAGDDSYAGDEEYDAAEAQ